MRRYVYVGGITDYPELYWAWTGCIVGPVAYLLALIHAFMWRKASSAVGSVVSFQCGNRTRFLPRALA